MSVTPAPDELRGRFGPQVILREVLDQRVQRDPARAAQPVVRSRRHRGPVPLRAPRVSGAAPRPSPAPARAWLR